ncbi:Receptor-like protein kinase HERK 1 [Bienertia sinuspersici]
MMPNWSLRFHYCDIVSTSTYELFFNVFVDSWMVSHVLDLGALTNGSLGTPIYVDFVTPDIRRNKLDISISPAIKHVNNPDSILNGLEIMKMSNLKHP